MKDARSDLQWRILATVAVSCLVVLTIVVVRREFSAVASDAEVAVQPVARASQQRQPPVAVDDWSRVTGAGHRIGSPHAPVTIVEFSDFECPSCRRFALETFPALEREFPGRIALLYRHYPLRSHPMALPAARAAECAAAQGRFKAFHDLVFVRHDSLRAGAFRWLAKAAGVPDVAKFDRCQGDGGTVQAIENDLEEVRRIGATGTPTLVINGLMIRPPYSAAAISTHIRAALRAEQ